jgi:hypothetical protein
MILGMRKGGRGQDDVIGKESGGGSEDSPCPVVRTVEPLPFETPGWW